ncbi:MAG: BadF/BadG/BcrA/BcrD ATPase family protein, partial [Myxococcota bacterium]|nr:BadF/BadG/BcrA/BcrD ATPase family protein [Myxococcota bacterium]
MQRHLGIDIGSRAFNAVVIDTDEAHGLAFEIVEALSRPIAGDLTSCWNEALALSQRHGCHHFGVTHSGATSGRLLDNTLCSIHGAAKLLPECRSIFSIGAQSFFLYIFDERGGYHEHVGNPPCAAGTGAFLEQQAERLGFDAEELSRRAAAYQGPVPSIATRCAVFAKTDIIHRMQEGFGVDAICAGLCEGVAKTVLDSLLKGRVLPTAIGVVGGVAANARLCDAIEAELGLPLQRPKLPWMATALGAALLGRLDTLDSSLETLLPHQRRERRPPLLRDSSIPANPSTELDGVELELADEDLLQACTRATLGVDVGSTSTKAALLDEQGRLLVGLYTATRGEPLQTVSRLFNTLNRAWPAWRDKLSACACTGSGRALVRRVFSMDAELDEISAHALAASAFCPEA